MADKTSFIYKLQPFELVYLDTQNIATVINGTVNELVRNEVIVINADKSIDLLHGNATSNHLQLQVTSILAESGTVFYPNLIRQLAAKPIFWNTSKCLNVFSKYFNKSAKFGSLFYLNFGILMSLILISFTRVATGILTNKPVQYVVILTFLLVVLTIVF